MIKLIESPAIIKAAGNKEKKIEEFIGRVITNTAEVSIARMTSPEGWVEPGQKPLFDEFTVVLKGTLMIKTIDREILVHQGQAVITGKNEWVQYSTPLEGGAEYIAICLPAFSPQLVNRDAE